MANPEPEITYEEAISGGAIVAGTGRSDFPNQVNNLLAFPGIFRGALDAKALKITEGMKMAAAQALANLITDDELKILIFFRMLLITVLLKLYQKLYMRKRLKKILLENK